MRGVRTAVVGAGIAGLAAARRLARAGADVLVFERARRPGGRTSTRRRDGLVFDHGAQYFTCRDPAFSALVDDWCARGVAARWRSPVVSLERGVQKELREDTARYVGVPSMSALARDLAADLAIVCRRVERIEHGEHGWRLVSGDGTAFDGFDRVLVATAAPQAAPLLAALPELERRVAPVEMQPCHAVMTAFESRPGAEFGGAFVSRSPLSWIARNASKPGRGAGECWVLHTTPEWSAAHLNDPLDAIASELLEAFAEALGGRPLPPVRYRDAHRWRFARSERPLGSPFLWNAPAGLGVCGDWCIGGRIEGAFLSGHRLARAVLDEPGPNREGGASHRAR